MRDVSIHDEPREECSHDAIHADEQAQRRAHAEHCHDKDKLHDGIAVLAQEVARHPRDEHQQEHHEDHQFHGKPYPEQDASAGVVSSFERSQAYECQQQCQHRSAHAQRDAGLALQSVATNDGVGDERVRRHQRAQQERCLMAVAQKPHRREVGEHEGNEERQQAEDGHLRNVLAQSVHVHLQRSQEHDVVEANLAEQLERVVALQNVQSVLAHEHAGEHHSDDVRNAQLAHDDRS